MSTEIRFTVKFKSKVDRFEVPDEDRETTSICENAISSSSESRKVVSAHRIGNGGSSEGGKYRACPPTPLGEHVHREQ